MHADEPTHREALAALDPHEIATLKALSDRPGLAHLTAHAALIAATAVGVHAALGTWAALPAMAVHGVALVFLFTAAHEAIHGTAFRTPALNAAVAEAAGFVIALPPRHFRYFHFAHHRHTQDPDHDPELATPKPRGWRAYLVYLSGLPYWRAQLAGLIAHAAGRAEAPYIPAAGVARVTAEARWHLAAYGGLLAAALAFGWTWPVWYWLVPVMLGQPALRAYLLAEHAACPLVADMLANTRTTFTNRAVRFLAWNMPHHTAHHAMPTVPFHRLPELTGLLRARLRSTAAGYVDAHRQIRAAWRPEPHSERGR